MIIRNNEAFSKVLPYPSQLLWGISRIITGGFYLKHTPTCNWATALRMIGVENDEQIY